MKQVIIRFEDDVIKIKCKPNLKERLMFLFCESFTVQMEGNVESSNGVVECEVPLECVKVKGVLK